MALPIEAFRNINIVRVAAVADALTLASRWQESGKADNFRGQVFPWPPRSSLDRWYDNHPGEVAPDLDWFVDWLAKHPTLSAIAEDADQALAIAQHFGIPTTLVDFTTDFEIAAQFSRDRPAAATYPGPEACIYCFHCETLFTWFKTLPKEQVEQLQLYPVDVKLPALHRLSAQSGLFMHAPGDWYEKAPIHCIVFERGPPLTELERVRLYPPTGRLEGEVRSFLHSAEEERFKGHLKSISPPVALIRMRPPPTELALACFLPLSSSNGPARVGDWPTAESPWSTANYRRHQEPITVQFSKQPEAMGNYMLSEAMIAQLAEYIKLKPVLAEQPLQFVMPPQLPAIDAIDARAIASRMSRAWNGMADFPYSIDQRLECLKCLILFGTSGIGCWRDDRVNVLKKMSIIKVPRASVSDRHRWCELALCERDGSCTDALISLYELTAALDPTLVTRLSDLGKGLLSSNPLELMRRVREPNLLFAFSSLVQCFATYLVPMQLLIRTEEMPIIFSAARLNYLGPP